MNHSDKKIKTTIDLELYKGFTITPNETSHILPLNFNDLNTDNTLRN